MPNLLDVSIGIENHVKILLLIGARYFERCFF